MNLISVLLKSASMGIRRVPSGRGGGRLCLLCLLAVSPVWADTLSEPGSHTGASGEQRLVPVPLPDLSRTEEAVRKRLNQTRAVLIEAVKSSEVTDAELAGAYGDTGTVYLSHQLYVAADACLANAHALAPKDYRWPYYLGYRFQQQDSNLEKAAESYQRVLSLRNEYEPTRVRLAQVYLDLDQAARAEPLLLAAMEQEGLRAAALFGLGRVAVAERDFQTAVEYFNQALAANPEATKIHYPLAMAYRALGDIELAKQHLARRGEGEPRVLDPLVDDLSKHLSGLRTLYYSAMEAMREGHFDVAVETFTAALQQEPGNSNARVTLARALYLQGDPAGAKTQLAEALERSPEHDLGLFLMGVLLEDEGDQAAALDLYRRTLKVDPQHSGAHHFLANALMRSGDYSQAARHYAAAVAVEPKNRPAKLMECLALIMEGSRPAVARERLEAGLADNPEDPMLTLALARLLATSKDDAVRDGGRALLLAQGLFDQAGTLENAETLAMAYAESARLRDAVALQENALSAVMAAGRFQDMPRLEENLTLYRKGKPCRTPWSPFDRMLYPASMGARGPFQEYPTRSAY